MIVSAEDPLSSKCQLVIVVEDVGGAAAAAEAGECSVAVEATDSTLAAEETPTS